MRSGTDPQPRLTVDESTYLECPKDDLVGEEDDGADEDDEECCVHANIE